MSAVSPLMCQWYRCGVTVFHFSLGIFGFSVALTVGALVASLVLERRAFADYAFAGALLP